MRLNLSLWPWSRAVVVLIMLAALTVTLVACEYPGVPHPLASQPDGVFQPTPTPDVPEPTATPQDGEPDAQEGPVNIVLKDFNLEPDQITVKAGTVTFILTNGGRYTHDFRVDGQGVDEKAPKVAVGRERRWEITLEPGEYRISCPISNHDERGMVGTLVVVE